jgi:DNA-binding MarR family transcriptional regulator
MGGSLSDSEQLQRQVMGFVRAFGLLDVEQTPCGQPMSASMAHALTELAGDEALSQGELGRLLGLEKSTVSRLVADLERRGWVERRRDDLDGRVLRLYLTKQGRRVSTQIATARSALFADLAEHLTARERPMVERALAALVRAVTGSKESRRASTMDGDRSGHGRRSGRAHAAGDVTRSVAIAGANTAADAGPVRGPAAQLDLGSD